MLNGFSRRTNQKFKVNGQTMWYAQSQEYTQLSTQARAT